MTKYKKGKTRNEKVLQIRSARKCEVLDIDIIEEGKWVELDEKKESLKPNLVPKKSAFLKLKINERCRLIDLFKAIITPELIENILKRANDNNPEAFQYQSNKKIKVSNAKIFQFFAIYIWIQAIQPKNSECFGDKNPQDHHIQKTIKHLKDEVPNVTSVLGVKAFLEILRKFTISYEDHDLFNKNLEDMILELGEVGIGDEKLFRFTGNSDCLRVVLEKPAQIGHWHYELIAFLENGLPFLVWTRIHHEIKALGESVNVSGIVKSWGSIVKKFGNENSILVMDSYYLDAKGRSWLTKNKVYYIASITSLRFRPIISQINHERVQKGGDWIAATNDKTNESIVCHWYKKGDLGKKFVLSNNFAKQNKPTKKDEVPLSDDYQACFNGCDLFNRYLHDRTWPFRCGGGNSPGRDRKIHDFFFSAILLNIYHSWLDKYGINPKDSNSSYKIIMQALSVELYNESSECSTEDIFLERDLVNDDYPELIEVELEQQEENSTSEDENASDEEEECDNENTEEESESSDYD